MRDDFSPGVRAKIAKRASYICSNPDCRSLTVAAALNSPDEFQFVGKAAHITAAAPKGPRYDASLSAAKRSGIENAIFLCPGCADRVDKNGGIDYPADLLRSWKSEHEAWTRANLNKSIDAFITVIDGQHRASGIGEVTALDIEDAAIIKPGTISTAQGIGNVTATRIGQKEREKR